MSEQQLYDDLHTHLFRKVDKCLSDHQDTCNRIDCPEDQTLSIACAVLIHHLMDLAFHSGADVERVEIDYLQQCRDYFKHLEAQPL